MGSASQCLLLTAIDKVPYTVGAIFISYCSLMSMRFEGAKFLSITITVTILSSCEKCPMIYHSLQLILRWFADCRSLSLCLSPISINIIVICSLQKRNSELTTNWSILNLVGSGKVVHFLYEIIAILWAAKILC